MTRITEEEWAAVRERFPEGSQIRLPSGETGLLNFIDAGGLLHINTEDGRSLTLTPDKDEVTAEPPDMAKMDTLKLYMPLSAAIGTSAEESAEIPPDELPEFQAEIAEAMSRVTHPAEADRGLMHWYCDSDSVNRKVHSATFRPERRDGTMWCVADCKLREPLSPRELKTLKGFVELHAATTWDDLLEKNPVRKGDSLLTVRIWRKDGWSIRTELERFEPKHTAKSTLGGKIADAIGRRKKGMSRYRSR